MIAQLFLLAILAGLFAYALTQRRRSKPLASTIIAASLIGGTLVLYPDMANAIARSVGIGRGADLITYVFILVTLATIFNIHLRLRSDHEALTQALREIAILKATAPR